MEWRNNGGLDSLWESGMCSQMRSGSSSGGTMESLMNSYRPLFSDSAMHPRSSALASTA